MSEAHTVSQRVSLVQERKPAAGKAPTWRVTWLVPCAVGLKAFVILVTSVRARGEAF
jgi:hypothetical protein